MKPIRFGYIILLQGKGSLSPPSTPNHWPYSPNGREISALLRQLGGCAPQRVSLPASSVKQWFCLHPALIVGHWNKSGVCIPVLPTLSADLYRTRVVGSQLCKGDLFTFPSPANIQPYLNGFAPFSKGM